jgi:branched-chain amino acid aminotransferase
MLDPGDMVAELATAKIFLAKEGVAITLVANQTFVDRTSRSQVMKLLRDADNCANVVPVIRTKDREL